MTLVKSFTYETEFQIYLITNNQASTEWSELAKTLMI